MSSRCGIGALWLIAAWGVMNVVGVAQPNRRTPLSVADSDISVRFGTAVAGVGDLNGNGTADLVVGSPRRSLPLLLAGQLQAFDGLTGQLLWSVEGIRDFESLGTHIAKIGDVDGDGVADLAAGTTATVSGMQVMPPGQ